MQGCDVASQTDSDGLGPDGWDDVLSAWMTNAGILGHQQQHHQEEQPPAADECGRYACVTPGPAFRAFYFVFSTCDEGLHNSQR